MWLRKAVLIVTLAIISGTAQVRTQPTTITVCASGCTYPNTQLQTAVNAALAGDLILLQEGFQYNGTVELPVKTGAGPTAITTIRTGVNATGVVQSTTRYPAADMRICPQGFVQDWYDCATRSPQDMTRIAKMVPINNDTPAITNVDTGSGTPMSYWRMQWIEFTGNVYGGNAIVIFSNDTLPMTTGTSLMMPHHIYLDQVVIRGRPVEGQFRGLWADSGELHLTNSHIYDIKAVGEGQAIWFNGVGPYIQINNYVSGGTETFFTGGSGTRPEPELTVSASPAPTATVMTVTGPMTDIYAEKGVAFHLGQVNVTSLSVASDSVVTTATAHSFQVGWEVDFDSVAGCSSSDGSINSQGAYPRITQVINSTSFVVEHRCDTSGSGGTVRARFNVDIASVAGSVITLAEALPIVPVGGEIINTGIVPVGITSRYNVFTHPSEWFTNPRIVALPTGSAAKCSTSGGTMAAGTYGYRVLARHRTAQNTWADSGAATEVTCAVASGSTGSVTVSWNTVPNATEYLVYGRTPGGQTGWWSAGTATTFTDTGSATGFTASSVDTSPTRWQLKNTYELKEGRNVLIEYNIIERAWSQGQVGSCLLFTPSMQGNDNWSATIRDVTVRFNEIRHCGQSIQISGTDAIPHESSRSGRYNINNNLFWDVAGDYNGGTPSISLSVGGSPRQVPNRGPFNVTFDHNTFAMDTSNDWSFALYYSSCHREMTPQVESPLLNFNFTNNIIYSGTYGLATENASVPLCTWQTGRIIPATSGTSSFNYNAIAGAPNCSVYTDDGASNACPTLTELHTDTFTGAILTNRMNYLVKATSPFYNSGSDGASFGPDIATLNTHILIAESGNNSGGSTPDPLTISTSSPLPTATTTQPYAVTITATGGTPPYAWAHTSGTMPTGLSFNTTTATITGTPSVATTNRSVTIRVTDSAAQQVSKTFLLTVQRFTARQSRYNWSEGAFFVRSIAPVNPIDQVRVGDMWYDTATSLLKKATDLGPPVTWELVGSGESNINASSLTSGTVPIDRLGASGTRSSSTYLRGDNTWATPSGGSSGNVVHVLFFSSTGTTYSNAPIGGGEWNAGANRWRQRLNLSGVTQCMPTANVVGSGATGAKLRLQYYDGDSWETSNVEIPVDANGFYDSLPYVTIPAGMRIDGVIVRLFVTDGDGTSDPSVSTMNMICKP
jgi:hypothetical protein